MANTITVGTIQDVLVVDGQAYHPPNKLEVVQVMFIVDTRLRTDL